MAGALDRGSSLVRTVGGILVVSMEDGRNGMGITFETRSGSNSGTRVP